MRKIFVPLFVAYVFISPIKIYADASDPSDEPTLPNEEIAISNDQTNFAAPESLPIPSPAPAQKPAAAQTQTSAQTIAKTSSITPFTGKILRNKVRMRLQPTLDAGVVRELNNGEMIVVVGENEDFFAIQPPSDVKGYIFRTFVL